MTALWCLVLSLCFAAPATWMADLSEVIGNRSIAQMCLPGTHDSGSYNLTDKLIGVPPYLDEVIKVADLLHMPVGKIIDGWSRAQATSFYEQFCDGIRYVDVRACWDESIWRTCHGPVLGNPMQVLWNDTKRFLDSHPGEVLVLEVSHFAGGPSGNDLATLARAITTTLAGHLYPPSRGLDAPLRTAVANGQRAIVTFDNGGTVAAFPDLWPGSTIINSYADSPVLPTMEAYNVGKVNEFVRHGRYYPGNLFKISWTLTPNGNTVSEMLLPGKPHTLLELADIANRDLLHWFSQLPGNVTGAYPILGNILIIDHQSASAILNVTTRNL